MQTMAERKEGLGCNMQQEGRKEKTFLLCVDSDGCAIDTMEIKHRRCFGPCLVEEWGLEPWKDEILDRWNQINLYSEFRGINRFKALAVILQEINQNKVPISGLEGYSLWIRGASRLSESALSDRLKDSRWSENICLQKALSWSKKVNAAIDKIPAEDRRAFPGVLRGLEGVHDRVDIAVVSSANRQAVLEEWRENHLNDLVDVFFAQDSGTKEACIRNLIRAGYRQSCILFVGDAPGDLDAALENGISFYPILAGDEEQSWKDFPGAIESFLRGNYLGVVQEREIRKFWNHLKGR